MKTLSSSADVAVQSSNILHHSWVRLRQPSGPDGAIPLILQRKDYKQYRKEERQPERRIGRGRPGPGRRESTKLRRGILKRNTRIRGGEARRGWGRWRGVRKRDRKRGLGTRKEKTKELKMRRVSRKGGQRMEPHTDMHACTHRSVCRNVCMHWHQCCQNYGFRDERISNCANLTPWSADLLGGRPPSKRLQNTLCPLADTCVISNMLYITVLDALHLSRCLFARRGCRAYAALRQRGISLRACVPGVAISKYEGCRALQLKLAKRTSNTNRIALVTQRLSL
eukprot:364029-Chlamydomonas_euryale.AAC.3